MVRHKEQTTMSQLPGQPSHKPKPPLYTWSEVWTAVITKPSIQTFNEILRDPAAGLRRSLIWVYLTSCFSLIVAFVTALNDPAVRDQLIEALPSDISSSNFFSTAMVSVIGMAPFIAALSLGVFLALAYGIQFIADQIGTRDQTQGKQPRLIYTLAAVLAPINILSLVLVMLKTVLPEPIMIVLLLIGLTYQVILMMFGVMAVYGFRVRQAAMALGIPLAGYLLLMMFFVGF
jgi:hypothetical protein